MKELRAEIIIHVPADRVWNILTIFKAFPEWNPFIKQISGESKERAVYVYSSSPREERE